MYPLYVRTALGRSGQDGPRRSRTGQEEPRAVWRHPGYVHGSPCTHIRRMFHEQCNDPQELRRCKRRCGRRLGCRRCPDRPRGRPGRGGGRRHHPSRERLHHRRRQDRPVAGHARRARPRVARVQEHLRPAVPRLHPLRRVSKLHQGQAHRVRLRRHPRAPLRLRVLPLRGLARAPRRDAVDKDRRREHPRGHPRAALPRASRPRCASGTWPTASPRTAPSRARSSS